MGIKGNAVFTVLLPVSLVDDGDNDDCVFVLSIVNCVH